MSVEAIKRDARTSKSNVRKVEISLSSRLMGSRDLDGNRAKRAKVFNNTHLKNVSGQCSF